MSSEPHVTAWVTISVRVRRVSDLKALLDAVDALDVGDDFRVRWSAGTAYVDVARGVEGELVPDGDATGEQGNQANPGFAVRLPHPTGETDADIAAGFEDWHYPELEKRSQPAATAAKSGPADQARRVLEEDDLPQFDWPSRDRARSRVREWSFSIDRYGDLTRPE